MAKVELAPLLAEEAEFFFRENHSLRVFDWREVQGQQHAAGEVLYGS